MLIYDYDNHDIVKHPNLLYSPISHQIGTAVKPRGIETSALRQTPAALPTVSELDALRHYTNLSRLNFSIDTHFYPLGSCTMKYNPRVCHSLAMLDGFISHHPLAPDRTGQGLLACLYELQTILSEVVGMHETTLAPMAGAHGEFAGISMIRAYHQSRGDHARDTIIVPIAAHGTNPATAAICGYKIKEIPCLKNGNVDLTALKAVCNTQTAGLMLTNPSTLGIFDSAILEITNTVHECGGMLYYDGANLNAILGIVRPGDMGFDVMHMNLHKTFSTPHGGGGPGAGAVAANDKLAPFLPVPLVGRTFEEDQVTYFWQTTQHRSQSIGHLSAFHGNIGILLRAYIYTKLLGGNGMRRVALFATLNANYLMACLKREGFDCTYAERRATHEFIISLKTLKEETGITAMDMAKRLLDKGFHAPTTYFPLHIPECLLIEPTETESKQTLDRFIAAMAEIRREAYENPELVKTAPHTMPLKRLDDVRAVRELNIRYVS